MNNGKILPFSIEMLKVKLVVNPNYKFDDQENPPEKYFHQLVGFFNRSSSQTVEIHDEDGYILIPISESANIEMYKSLWTIHKIHSKKQENTETIPKHIELKFTTVKCTTESFDNFLYFCAEATS